MLVTPECRLLRGEIDRLPDPYSVKSLYPMEIHVLKSRHTRKCHRAPKVFIKLNNVAQWLTRYIP